MAAVAYADLPAGVVLAVDKNATTGWPARPTSRTDITVLWVGAAPAPTIVSSGTGGALAGDEHHLTP